MALSWKVRTLGLFAALAAQVSAAEMQPQKISPASLIASALQNSSLGMSSQPFHAVLQIESTGDYSGKIELWWRATDQYRLQITSPSFSQTKVVNGAASEEQNTGDYYPRWIENFVLAILNPLPKPSQFTSGSLSARRTQDGICLQRDDRPGGITDQLTWGSVCFAGSEPVLSSILTFNESMTFSDWQSFGTQRIARQYETSVRDYQAVMGHLKLEAWVPQDSLLQLQHPTLPEQRIETEFVSTSIEEAKLERAPQIVWPPVREGKTEGYMIVYARTDRTGQVREAAKHNSDQPGLEDFGMEQALQYKFKPLLVNGVAVQMEMPLVLHFNSALTDPVPILNVEDMKKQLGACPVPSLSSASPKGTVVQVQITIDEAGKLIGAKTVGNVPGSDWLQAINRLRSCHFTPLIREGKATSYKGLLELKR